MQRLLEPAGSVPSSKPPVRMQARLAVRFKSSFERQYDTDVTGGSNQSSIRAAAAAAASAGICLPPLTKVYKRNMDVTIESLCIYVDNKKLNLRPGLSPVLRNYLKAAAATCPLLGAEGA